MKFLVIEDNDIKFGLLVNFLSNASTTKEIVRAASYQAGIEKLVYNKFDWVFLDMTLPVSDLALSPVDMEFLTLGGQYVLRECHRRAIRTKIIIVSQYKSFVLENRELSFEQLRDEIMLHYKELVIGCVYLDRASDAWKLEISKLLNYEDINH